MTISIFCHKIETCKCFLCVHCHFMCQALHSLFNTFFKWNGTQSQKCGFSEPAACQHYCLWYWMLKCAAPWPFSSKKHTHTHAPINALSIFCTGSKGHNGTMLNCTCFWDDELPKKYSIHNKTHWEPHHLHFHSNVK